MKFVELFAGVGGFHYGIQRARTNNIFECAYANEWNRYAASVYARHFDQCDERDIRTVTATDIPDHDLLTAGFPCQSFSVAGLRKGFLDTRGSLFFEICRVVEKKRPRFLLLENVKGLLFHDAGKTFNTILASLSELGYDCQWQVLNSKDFFVPQNRERVYIVGHLRGTARPQIFPLWGNSQESACTQQEENKSRFPVMLSARRTELGKQSRQEIRSETGRDVTLRSSEHKEYRTNNHQLANCLTTEQGDVEKWLVEQCNHEAGEGRLIELTQSRSQAYRVYAPEGLSTTIASQAGGLGAKTGLYAITKGRSDDIWKSSTIAPPLRTGDKANYSVIANENNRDERHDDSFADINIRRLTPVECERLQGFPDNWTQMGVHNEFMSDTQRYKMMGNAVTTTVVAAIIAELSKSV